MSWKKYFRRRRWDQERARELQAYLEFEIEENKARGLSVEEARRAAHLKLGNPVLIREEIYRMNTVGFLESILQDLRYGARLLRLNPGFASVAILSLALGIGANTAIFQLIDAVRIRTLPVKNPSELAVVRIVNMQSFTGGMYGRVAHVTYPIFERIRKEQQSFSSLMAWNPRNFDLSAGGEQRLAQGLFVSDSFFETLGVTPMLGRLFAPRADASGCGADAESGGVVVSYSFWRSHFGGKTDVLGKKLILDGHPFEVIGVTPASFFGVEVGRGFDVAVPLCAERIIEPEGALVDDATGWWLGVLGRLKAGWSPTRANAHLKSISRGIFEATLPPGWDAEDGKNYLGYQLGALPGETGYSSLRRDYSNPLAMLLAIAGLVLLIACANLANLMLARASAREREIAVRASMGASGGRLLRQLLAESLMVAALGSAFGILLAREMGDFLVSFLSTHNNPLFVDLATDWRVLGFTAGLTILTCLLFGLTPALRAARTSPGEVLKAASRGITAGRSRFGLRRMLVIAQVALTCMLLVGALLFTRSLSNVQRLDAGFQQDGILVANVNLQRLKLPNERRLSIESELLDRVRRLPGVESAAETSVVPLSGAGNSAGVWMDGAGTQASGSSKFTFIGANYFRTLGTPLLAGRDLNARDTTKSPRVAIVNEAFARRYFGGANPVGKSFRSTILTGKPDTAFAIAGLAGNTKYDDIREDFKPIAFLARAQNETISEYDPILIRSRGPAEALTSAVTRTLGELHPEIGVEFRVLKTEIRSTLLRERLMATLSGFFGALAVLLAAIGLYGVMSYLVARRRNEIGIRMALGASVGAVRAMILREAGILIGIGLAIGMVASALGSSAARSMLYGLQPRDPMTLAMAVALLALIGFAASYLPARRASRLDPMTALREE